MRDQVQSTFEELKRMDLINRDRPLKRRAGALRPWLTFRAGSFFSPKAICYSSRYSDLGENEARFALMHEEGHFVNRQNSRLLHLAIRSAIWMGLFLGLLVFVSILMVIADHGVDLRIVATLFKAGAGITFVLLIIAAAARVSAQKGIELDEDNSDDFAAERLKQEFAVRFPSHVLDSLLGQLERKRPDDMHRVGSVLKFRWGNVHRSRQERVERIARKYDDSTP